MNKFFSFFVFLCIPSFAYWDDLKYCATMNEHKSEFFSWVKRKGLENDYARVIMTVGCNDADDIPKHADAGKVFEVWPIPYQVMHNGIKVVKDGYCAAWMTDLIYGLKGHHEPQEERAFYEVLKFMPRKASMIELGSYWGYYSLWFAKEVQCPTNYLIEPDQSRLDLGRTNFVLNGFQGNFIRGSVGFCSTDAGDHQGSRSILIDTFFEENNITHLQVLHADIQGSEYELLLSAKASLEKQRIDFLFISTHSEKLHHNCISLLESFGYLIIAEHSCAESYSVDGLIVAKRRDISGPNSIRISKKTC